MVLIRNYRYNKPGRKTQMMIYLTNYDNDTSNIFRMVEIVMRDNYGSSNQNGYGNLVIKTGNTGDSVLSERVIVKHNGYVGVWHIEPMLSMVMRKSEERYILRSPPTYL